MLVYSGRVFSYSNFKRLALGFDGPPWEGALKDTGEVIKVAPYPGDNTLLAELISDKEHTCKS